jgi:hypothetical protein
MPFDSSPPGAAGANRVYRLDYSMPNPAGVSYAVGETVLAPNLQDKQVFLITYRGSGSRNKFEFKIEDTSGNVYIRSIANGTDTGGNWRTLRIPVQDFSPFGSVPSFDLRNLRKIHVALSKGDGGSGTVDISDIEVVPPGNQTLHQGGTVLERVQILDNPFSPNGDGLRDTGRFVLTLKTAASVRMTFFNLRGLPVRTYDLGTLAAGDQSMFWDGLDDDGRPVANGLYLFRISAEAPAGGHDVMKNVVGVAR